MTSDLSILSLLPFNLSSILSKLFSKVFVFEKVYMVVAYMDTRVTISLSLCFFLLHILSL